MRVEDLARGAESLTGMSRLADWYASDDRLVGVSASAYRDRAIQLLAYGLEHADGRELQLVLPIPAVEPTLARAACLAAPMTVYANRRGEVGEGPQSGMSFDEAVRWYGRLGPPRPLLPWLDEGSVTGSAAPPTWPEWLVALVDHVEMFRVERVRRPSYRSWHYRGRQVLKVVEAKNHVIITAGVNYQKPAAGQPAAVVEKLSKSREPSVALRASIREAVEGAVLRRHTAEDAGHAEHLLQGAIGTDPSLIGLTEVVRELPAWRPSGKKPKRAGGGFLDFVGLDVDGTLHAVETKIGPDAQLGLQALDYWLWCTAHRHELDRQLGGRSAGVELDVVLGHHPTKTLMHPAARATLQALHGAVPWRCHIVDGWNTLVTPLSMLVASAENLPSRTLP